MTEEERGKRIDEAYDKLEKAIAESTRQEEI